MAQQTIQHTSTTNNAGVPPAPPEAHQRAGVEVKTEDVEALRAMLKNRAPTIRAAAVALIRDLRAGGFPVTTFA